MARKVFLFSGHMIDREDRAQARFPADKAILAGKLISLFLQEHHAGDGDIGLTSGACGGDILFAEACLDKGLKVELILALPEEEFIGESVGFAGQEWIDRFYAIKNNRNTKVSVLSDSFIPYDGLNVFARTNLQLIETALHYTRNGLYFIALWDGKAGDGPGGTQHMVETVNKNKGSSYILNPHTMKLLERLKSPGPKRILALDGGGIRGAITLGYLEKIESILRKKHGNPKLTLSDYFDLIGGTSTGAIIASALAIGKDVSYIKKMYLDLGDKIFAKKWKVFLPWHTKKYLKARFGAEPLKEQLEEVFGDITLGDERIKTGLCVVAKRADTQSTWPLINHPEGKYFKHNKPILLKNAVRASTAAPTYFVPELFDVGFGQVGAFVDGGVSMANNPALQLFLVATLKGFPFHWETGADKLMIVSIGTGMSKPMMKPAEVADDKLWDWAMHIPDMLMQDASWLNQIMLQYMSTSPTAWEIDKEIGDLGKDLIAPTPLLTYQRYNIFLEEKELNDLGLNALVKKPGLKSLQEMSNGENVNHLALIGEKAAIKEVEDSHLPDGFNLTGA